MKKSMAIFVVFIGVLVAFPAISRPTPQVITYANGAVMKDERGNVYYHDGSLFISSSGTMYYPPWQSRGNQYERVFRHRKGWGNKLFFYLPNGKEFGEHSDRFYYPRSETSVRRETLTDGWSFYYRNRERMCSRDAANFYHDDGSVAWDRGTRIWRKEGHREVQQGEVPLTEYLDPMNGEFTVCLIKELGRVRYEFLLWLEIFHAGYISPIVYHSESELPQNLFKDMMIHMQTGYDGELLTVRVDKSDKVYFKFEQIRPQPPMPRPNPNPNPNPWPPRSPNSPNVDGNDSSFERAPRNPIGRFQHWCGHRGRHHNGNYPDGFVRSNRTR